jgi:hypothetical protein
VLVGCFALFFSSLPSAVSLAVNGGFSRVEPLVVAVEAMGLLSHPPPPPLFRCLLERCVLFVFNVGGCWIFGSLLVSAWFYMVLHVF